MGSVLSSSAPESSTTQVVKARCLSKPEIITVCVKGNEVDFYELFGFERYSRPERAAVQAAFGQQSLHFHPDKYRGDDEAEKAMFSTVFRALVIGRRTLLDASLKGKYDAALQRSRGERGACMTMVDWMSDNWRLLVSGGCAVTGVAGPIALAVCGLTPAGWVAGIGFAAFAGALGSGGLRGAMLANRDPEQPLEEWAKEVLKAAKYGALVGGTCQVLAQGAIALMGGSAAVQAGSAGATGASTTVQAGAKAAASAVSNKAVNTAVAIADVADDAAQAFVRFIASLASGSGQLAIAAAAEDRLAGPIYAVLQRSDSYNALMAKSYGKGPRDMKGFECIELLRAKPGHEGLAAELENYTDPGTEACLRTYTAETPLYRSMNKALLGDVAELWHFANYVHNLRLELRNRGNQRGWITSGTVWRGAVLPPDQVGMWTTKGSKFLNAGFMSSSRKRDQAEKFMKNKNALLEIDFTGNFGEGRGWTYAVHIADISKFPEEDEVLIYPYSGFEVVSSTQVDGTWHVQLHVLDTQMVEKQQQCAKEHTVYEFTHVKGTHICDRCKCKLAVGAQAYRCEECDYDVCSGCLVKLD